MRFISKGLFLLPLFLCAAAGQSIIKLVPDEQREVPQDFTLQVIYGDRYIGPEGTIASPDGTRSKIPLNLMQEVPSMTLKPYLSKGADKMDVPNLDGKFIIVMLRKSPADKVTWTVTYLHHNYEITYESKEAFASYNDQLFLTNDNGYPPVPYQSPTMPSMYKFIVYRQPEPLETLSVDLEDFNQLEFEEDNGLEAPAAKSVTFDTYEYEY